jgi:DNA-binding NarL/FixJ family response regulator
VPRPRSKRTRYEASDDRLTLRMLAETNSRLTALLERFAAMLGQAPASPAENMPARVIVPLTRRELEVALLIVEGLSTSQIAARLVVEAATVKTHRRGISRKCGTSSKAGLAAKRGSWEGE